MEHVMLVIKDYVNDRLGIGNILKCLITALSINNNVVIQCYPDYIYGMYDTILDDKFIFKDTTKQIESVYTCRLLLLQHEIYQENIPNEEWYINGLNNSLFDSYFLFHKQIDWNYNPDLVHDLVKERIFNTIDKITFNEFVMNQVNKNESIFKWYNDTKSLGISIRTWKSKHEQNIDRPYDTITYIAKIKKVIQMNAVDNIVLSIDNHEYIEPYITLCNELHIHYIILDMDNSMNDIQYAIIKALTLARCTYFIGNRISTFSELVFWFSKCRVKVYPVF